MCAEHIVALFGKSDVPAKLLWRPQKTAAHFKESHPKLYVKWFIDESVFFPCDTVKAQPVVAWGPQRAQFIFFCREDDHCFQRKSRPRL